MRAWSVRVALTLVVGLVFAVGSSEEANAVSRDKDFRFGQSFCVNEQASTYASPRGVLYGESVTWSLGDYYGPCSSVVTKPAGYISGRLFVYKWSERDEDWRLCRKSGWLYNGTNTYALSVYAPLGYPGDRWCGSGWYGTEAQGAVWHRGAWRTTERVWSGYDYYY